MRRRRLLEAVLAACCAVAAVLFVAALLTGSPGLGIAAALLLGGQGVVSLALMRRDRR